VDHGRSEYQTNEIFCRILCDVGLEVKDHNTVAYMKFSIVECIMGSYSEGFVGQVREFLPI